MPRILCPKCGSKFGTPIRRGKRRCKTCRYEWNPQGLPLRLRREQWRRILEWFLLGLSSNRIAERTKLPKPRILRALAHVRQAMARDVPSVFSGIVEVDETYMGGQWKNKRKAARAKGTKRGRGTSKQPVFGIYARQGIVWARLVDDVEAATLLPLIRRQVRKGSTVCSDTFRSYTGVAMQGYVHRMVEHGKGEYSDRKGTHINGLEGFWGYLKRQLAAKGGIRRERLGLYLAEYVWRYNHRKLPVETQLKKLLNLLKNRRYLVAGV